MSSSTQLISGEMNQLLQLFSSLSIQRLAANSQQDATTQNANILFADFIENMRNQLGDLERERAQLTIRNNELRFQSFELTEVHQMLMTNLNEEFKANHDLVANLQNESAAARTAQTAARTALAVANAAEVAALAAEASVETLEALATRIFRQAGFSKAIS